MIFPDGYELGLTPIQLQRKWPNLQENTNFEFTSEQTWDYNCVAYAAGINDDWVQFSYEENGDLKADQSVQKYIEYFLDKGFIQCENSEIEEGLQKICIYTDDNNLFTHVALQLSDGSWTSKMGEFEDIQHTTLDNLSGNFYGKPSIYMRMNV